jgi:hypothetical protein
MNRAAKFALVLLLFIAPRAMAEVLSRSDFYGVWRYSGANGTMVCVLTEDSWKIRINNDKPIRVEILKWEQVDNDNVTSSRMFPWGFRITFQRSGGSVDNTTVCIDREKKHILLVEFSEDGDEALARQ